MDLCISVFVYVGLIVLYKRIVNAHTQSIRIANADGQGPPLNTFKHPLLHSQAARDVRFRTQLYAKPNTVSENGHSQKIVIYLIINEVTFWHGF